MLYINHNLKAIFIHNPKCGGTTIGRILTQYYDFECIDIAIIDAHTDKEYIMKGGSILDLIYENDELNMRIGMSKEKWKSYYKFSILRDPYLKFISAYFFLRQNINRFKVASITENKTLFCITNDDYYGDHVDLFNINEYVNLYVDLSRDNGGTNISLFSFIHMFMKQSDFLHSDNFVVDFIGKLENIDAFFYTILCHLKLPKKWDTIPIINKTVYWYNDDEWGDYVREFIKMYFKNDYLMYHNLHTLHNH